MKSISIVIPVYNEEGFIGGLLESIRHTGYPADHYEVIVVSDGSTDRTVGIVRSFPEVRLIELPRNEGRYLARQSGAQAARHPYILFIDARSVVDPGILAALDPLPEKVVNGHSLGAENPNAFEVFYGAIRRLVFGRFYRQAKQPIPLTLENFDQMPKGTGVLCVEKELLFAVYGDLSGRLMGKETSDDTALLRALISRSPGVIHPGVKIINYARPDFNKSLAHLFQRGPKFVDYYLNPRQRNFWLVIVLPLLGWAAILAMLAFAPISAGAKAAFLLGADLFLTALLARSPAEFATILVMLPLCAAVFYVGILYGIWLKILSAFPGE
jgi:glycosyltransferase involved in cell wall biosynthesis